MKLKDKKIKEFLQQSNFIEREYSDQALSDAEVAWAWAQLTYGDKPMDIKGILGIHKLLMTNLRPDIAGKIRDCGVYIGGQYKPFLNKTMIEADLFMKVIFEMIARIDGTKKNKEDKCKRVHIAFEGIHPFVDGNGRVGRILYNFHRLKMGLPIHVIHEGDEQQKYYSWFRS